MKPLICIFSQTLGIGGAEKQVVLLAKVLSKHANVCVLVFYEENNNAKFIKMLNDFNTNVIILKGNKIVKFYKVFKIFRSYKFDMLLNYLLLPNFVGGVLAKLAGIKYSIGGIRTAHIEKNKVLLNKIAHNFLNSYTIYNNYSGYNKYTAKGFNKKKGLVFQNCIEVSSRSAFRSKNSKVIILSVGRFHLAKDYLTALKSIKIIYENFKDIEYKILGYGEEEKNIRNFIKDNFMADYVKIYEPPHNTYDFYQEADIYLQTSIFEGLSNTIMEAMASSLPLVVTDVGDNSTLFEENIGGFLCQSKDVNNIVAALEKLITDPKLRQSMGQSNYNIISKNYSIEEFGKKYIQFMRKLSIDI